MNLLLPTERIELNIGETITFNQVTGNLPVDRIEGDFDGKKVTFDNEDTDLEATNTEDAIKEVDSKVNEKADASSLATVATSGNYNDLTNKPTIPAAQVNSDWNANSGVAQILNKPTIPTVNYDTEPTAGHGTGYTVTSAGIKQAIDGVQNDLNSYKNAVSYLKEGQPIETTPANVWEEGIWLNKKVVANSSYRYSSEISVTPGQRVYVSARSGINTSMRFIETYNSNGAIIDTVSTDTAIYKVPANAASLRVTVYSGNYALKTLIVQTPTYYYQLKTNTEDIGLSTELATAEADTKYSLASNIDNKKNCEYSFWGKFSSFTALEIGHGKTEYGGVYLVIDDTNITTYAHTGEQFQQFAHGLTISDFIFVSIKVADTYGARAVINLQTNGGIYNVSNVIFFGCHGDIYFKSTAQMTDVKFGYTIMDLKKDVFVFGDSYISLADNMKWVYYAISNNDNNMLLCGFGGATANDEIKSFRNILPLKTPKYLVWALGMNNPDTTVINSTWKLCTDEVIEYCENNDIELILATIPNTPSMNNMLKNEYVRASGHRYIDFAKAVGAETSGSSWYSGMLSSDNVHPTQDGAKALWLRALLDCPEIIC